MYNPDSTEILLLLSREELLSLKNKQFIIRVLISSVLFG